MIFRRKLLAVFALMVFVSVASVAGLVLVVVRNAFEKTDAQRTAALVAQFQHEFDRQGEEVARRVAAIAASDSVSRMATALNTASPDSERISRSRSLAGGQSSTRFSGIRGRSRNDHLVGAVAGKVRLSGGRVRESFRVDASRVSF